MGILVFASYMTIDTKLFPISKIAENLTNASEIDDVLYWEQDLDDDIYEYMNRNLKNCDVFLLFCSENIENSEPLKMEWMTALKLKKKIIPVFFEEDHIPPLLSTKYGIYFDKNNVQLVIEKLHQLILRKYKSTRISPKRRRKPEILEEIKPIDKSINTRTRLIGDYYIRKIIISGFTSYGNRTTTVGFSNNFTCIVGPNGSGKSNFVNAFLFALDSFKDNISNLEDLIYKSYKKKDSVKEASVTLQFDHRRGVFPNYPFFNLTRIIQEDGSDVRKINKEIVSDSEYKNALATTDIDHDSIKSQKFFLDYVKIGEFINANPNNRLKYIGNLIGAYSTEDYKWNYEKFEENFILIKREFYKSFLKFFPEHSIEILVDNERNLYKGEFRFKFRKDGNKILSFKDLSEGARCFTFLLLYFAIMKIFQSPLYILDEIDNTLDSRNLINLGEILEDISLNSQIIMASHREEVILYSNTIFGLSKRRDGVTDIFSVALEEERKIDKDVLTLIDKDLI